MRYYHGQIRSGRYRAAEKTASLRQQRMGSSACRCGFQTQVRGVRTSDYDSQKACGKKHKRNSEKSLKSQEKHAIVDARDILIIPCSRTESVGQRPKGGKFA